MKALSRASLGATFAAIVLVGLVLASPAALADAGTGKFDPQIQFPVGTQLTFSSINGVAFQMDSFSKPRFAQYDASLTITAQVDNVTKNGGIHWQVTGGSFIINGQSYTVTRGQGVMGSHDEIARMGGEATGPDGQTYRWKLQGFASLYNGVVIAGLRGGIGTIESDNAILRYRLGFVTTVTA